MLRTDCPGSKRAQLVDCLYDSRLAGSKKALAPAGGPGFWGTKTGWSPRPSPACGCCPRPAPGWALPSTSLRSQSHTGFNFYQGLRSFSLDPGLPDLSVSSLHRICGSILAPSFKKPLKSLPIEMFVLAWFLVSGLVAGEDKIM